MNEVKGSPLNESNLLELILLDLYIFFLRQIHKHIKGNKMIPIREEAAMSPITSFLFECVWCLGISTWVPGETSAIGGMGATAGEDSWTEIAETKITLLGLASMAIIWKLKIKINRNPTKIFIPSLSLTSQRQYMKIWKKWFLDLASCGLCVWIESWLVFLNTQNWVMGRGMEDGGTDEGLKRSYHGWNCRFWWWRCC